MWDEAEIAPTNDQFPFISISRTDYPGFVIHCFDHVQSQGHFLVRALDFSDPVVRNSLGGQVTEKWPKELFVQRRMVCRAMECFLNTGRRDSGLKWVETGGFPRVTVSEF